jgi:hypothetical protein
MDENCNISMKKLFEDWMLFIIDHAHDLIPTKSSLEIEVYITLLTVKLMQNKSYSQFFIHPAFPYFCRVFGKVSW